MNAIIVLLNLLSMVMPCNVNESPLNTCSERPAVTRQHAHASDSMGRVRAHLPGVSTSPTTGRHGMGAQPGRPRERVIARREKGEHAPNI